MRAVQPGAHELATRSLPRSGRSRPRGAGRSRSTAAGMDVEDGPEVRHAHRRALDVPAGSPGADRRYPTTARRAWGPSRGRSRARRPSRTRPTPRARRPAAGPDRGVRACRTPARTRSGRRSTRRRCGRRVRARATLDERDDLRDVLGRPGQDVGRGHAQGRSIVQELARSSARRDRRSVADWRLRR